MTDRIASNLADIDAHYTAVVVGSGYGAGVAASRLARAGQRVAVLERGREIRPGEYPNDLGSAAADLQANGERGHLGAADGLYELHLNRDMLAVVGCGLGGTSLINANVALEMDPRLFASEPWPAAYRDDPSLLKPYAERARRMLGVSTYPEDWRTPDKMASLQDSARGMGAPFRRTPIAVNFQDQLNPFGVPQPKCNNCGDCTSGCNVGAKNTTLMNYLPDARRHGAAIFTGARVTHVEREGSRWRVHFEPVALRGQAAPDDHAPRSVTADLVLLGAGALGSTEILLRSRDRGLPLSDRLGQRFSGNGDVLAWSYDNAGPDPKPGQSWPDVHGIGAGSNALEPEQMPGPCITGVIDLRGATDPRQGLVIEEGVIPGALASMMAPALFFADALGGGELRYGADQAEPRLTDAQLLGSALMNDPGSLTGLAYRGPVARTQTYLVMSVDEAAGTLRLVDDRLRIDWPGAGDSPTIARDQRRLADAADAVEGVFVPNPISTEAMGRKLVTVHPLGGCGMGDDATQGVVDADGRVYAGAAGTAVHEGLFVCDGAMLPGPAGVNPLLTIAALAERQVERLCAARGWATDLTLAPAGPLPAGAAGDSGGADHATGLAAHLWHDVKSALQQAADHLERGAIDLARQAIGRLIDHHPEVLSPSFQFTEQMHGWVSLDDIGSDNEPDQAGMVSRYERACAWGRAAGQRMGFELTIRTEDLWQMLSDPAHPARITGQVDCPALHPQPMPVVDGRFQLLPVDPSRVETWTMNYRMTLQRGDGQLAFEGHKVVHQREGSSPWTDTTTLFVTVHDGVADGPMLARGQLTLDLEDLLRQATTIRLVPPPNLAGDVERHVKMAENAISRAYLAKFAGFFGGVLFRAYGGLLADLANFAGQDLVSDQQRRQPDPQQPRQPRRPFRVPGLVPEPHAIDVGGGFSIRLTRWRGGVRGPVLLAPGFGVAASSFATDTVDCNLVESLCAAGYDTWLFDYRASPASGSPADAAHPYSIDDIARIDWPAAVDFVRGATGAASVQAIAHCVGSMSLLMALADGLQGVRSLVSSQLTLHPVTSWLNQAKADIGLVKLLEARAELNGRFDCVPASSRQAADPHDAQAQAAARADARIDVLAWGVPVPDGEACKNPVCRRVFALFGPSYRHAQLGAATHTAMAEWFGAVALSPFEQLSLIMQRGQAVDRQGQAAFTSADALRRLQLPIAFIAGARNQIFYPETSLRTLAWLRSANDPSLYVRRVFDDYAHMDLFIGRDAARDVHPWLIAQLARMDG